MAKTQSAKAGTNITIELPRMRIERAVITLIGDSPLICHRWSEKARKEMGDKDRGKAKAARAPRNPEQEYKETLYPLGKGFGFPSVAFKSAAVDSCSHLDGVTKVEARGAFHIDGELVPIFGTPEMREDMVRIGMGTAQIRYRGMFREWRTKFTVRYNAHVLTLEQVTNLFQTAGFAIGVGEWRPQKDGIYGLFHVEGA